MRKVLPLLLVLLSCSGIYGYFALTNRPDRKNPDPEDPLYQLGTEGITLNGYCNRGDNINLLESISDARTQSGVKVKVEGHAKIFMQGDRPVSYPELADYVLKIDYFGKHVERKAKGITSFSWSEKLQSVFFVQADSTTVKDSRTFKVWQWNPEIGFRPLTRSYRYLMNPTMSVNGRYLATKTDTRIMSLYDLDQKSEEIIMCPENGTKPLVIDQNTMLYFNSAEGCFFRFNRQSGQNLAFEIDGYFTDMAGFNGSIWGVRRRGKIQEIVRLNKDLASIALKLDLPY
jgi:hypothetical protein